MTDPPAGAAPGTVPAAGPVPLGVRVGATGDEGVDALIARLGDADALPTEDHIAVYEDVHRGLRDTLTALDAQSSVPGPAGGPVAPGPPSNEPYNTPYNDRS